MPDKTFLEDEVMNYYKWDDETISEEEWIYILENHSDNFMNYFKKESQRINILDETDQDLQLRQLGRIMGEMTKLQEMEKERNRREVEKKLIIEGVVFKESPYTSEELKKKWEQAFLSHMTQEEKNYCHIDEYLWHSFTYQKMKDYLEGSNAISAFNEEKKDKVFIFWQLQDKVLYLETNNKLSWKYLRLELGHDVYVVDSNFTWTYLLKHMDKRPIWYKKSNY